LGDGLEAKGFHISPTVKLIGLEREIVVQMILFSCDLSGETAQVAGKNGFWGGEAAQNPTTRQSYP